MSSIIFDAMVKAERKSAPPKQLEQIIMDVKRQIADIEYVNTYQQCFDKIKLSVDDMKVLLNAITQ